MFISLTRLRIRSLYHLLPFLWWNERVVRQLVKTSGLVHARLLVDARRTFWTVTGWESESSMRAFRSTGAHAGAMPRLARWCDEASIAHWVAETFPSWEEAHERLQSQGRLSKVNRPSAAHEARRFERPRVKPLIQRQFGQLL